MASGQLPNRDVADTPCSPRWARTFEVHLRTAQQYCYKGLVAQKDQTVCIKESAFGRRNRARGHPRAIFRLLKDRKRSPLSCSKSYSSGTVRMNIESKCLQSEMVMAVRRFDIACSGGQRLNTRHSALDRNLRQPHDNLIMKIFLFLPKSFQTSFDYIREDISCRSLYHI
jgi:hypothetical protein